MVGIVSHPVFDCTVDAPFGTIAIGLIFELNCDDIWWLLAWPTFAFVASMGDVIGVVPTAAIGNT